MNAPNDIVYFRKALLSWFGTHRRDFPWRKEEVSNYEVIFSEVLLQRTKAETVSRFYETFFGRFPNWDVLTEATVEELETFLKPLGLSKHRSKRIFRIAREYKERQGILPQNRYELQDSEMASLYLGNAYELFILKHRSALIDVNMARLLNRYFAPEGAGDLRINKALQVLAKTVINVRDCKELNWAILDLAAMVCRPQKPKCGICPLRRRCRYIWLV
jgi:A/G-specific adenine glycosylase